jgi:hypothetical protein
MNEAKPKAAGLEPNTGLESDEFDLANLRLDQSFIETAGVKKLLTTVPVRKPNPQDWVRVHPDPTYREVLAVIELKDDRETFLVPPAIAHELPGEYIAVTIYLAINRQRVVFLWPVRLPDPSGRVLDWHRSAQEAVTTAMKCWVRVKSNMSLRAYDILTTDAKIAEPEWPDAPLKELVRVAFRDRLINRLDHPVIQLLRGLA